MKSEINLVLTLLHTVRRSCKSLAKQNYSRSQNAAVGVFLALWSVLTIMQLVTGKKVCSSEKKVLFVIRGFGWTLLCYQAAETRWWHCKSLGRICLSMRLQLYNHKHYWVNKFTYGPKHCSPPQINERKLTGNIDSQQFPHTTVQNSSTELLHLEKKGIFK